MSRPVEVSRARPELDGVVGTLRSGLSSWLSLPLPERVSLLRTLRGRIGARADEIVAATSAAQGVGSTGRWAAEPWGGPLAMVQAVRSLEHVLGRLAAGKDPLASRPITVRNDGSVVVEVFPSWWDERVFFAGHRGQVWLAPGLTAEQVRRGAGTAYRGHGFDQPGVALLLGGGNADALVVTDLLHLMFEQGCVVAVKMNPVLDYLRPHMEDVLEPFLARDWVRFVDESVPTAQYLAGHPGIDRIHMTGSRATYDALMWGADDRADSRRETGQRLVDKPFTAELGGVAPMIVVPGAWSGDDVRRQADVIVSAKLANVGHLCASPQVLVLPAGWPHAEPLLGEIRRLMRALPPRAPWYPGTDAKVARAVAGQPNVEELGGPGRRILVHLDPAEQASLFTDEVFADVLGVVRLPADSVPAFLDRAVGFANNQLAGTLAASLLIDNETQQTHAAAIDRATAGLRYGSIGINNAFDAAALGSTTWGAYPGHTPEAIGSGLGKVLNSYLLPHPQRSVVTTPFRPRPTPQGPEAFRRLVGYWATDDLRRLPGILLTALRT